MKRINRTRSQYSISNLEYKVRSNIIDSDPYPDEGTIFYPRYIDEVLNNQIKDYWLMQ